MTPRLPLVPIGWAVVGAGVALAGLREVDGQARLLVLSATVVGPILALGSAVLLARRSGRGAGSLLVLSALVTPTYFAWALNLVPLVVGGCWVLGAAPGRQEVERPP